MSTSPPPSKRGSITAKSVGASDPILRNALRYTISAKEYETLHRYIISRSKTLERHAPSVGSVERAEASRRTDRDGNRVSDGSEQGGRGKGSRSSEDVGVDYNAAAVRASLRVFLASGAALKAWGVTRRRFTGEERTTKTSLWKSPTLRLSLSLSTILLFHRLLFRFFTRLRAQLMTDESQPFRKRNPRTSKTLTSKYAPAVGASLAGFMLGVYPADQLRITIAIYVFSRALEETYTLAEEQGWIWGSEGSRWEKPKWFGSWLLMPIAAGQLLHAFVFDRDCFPEAYGKLILANSPEYIQQRPDTYPMSLVWPNTTQIVENLAEISRLRYPRFISPILFPNQQTLPPTLKVISPITAGAHPLITSLSCALLHPNDPSCLRTYLKYYLTAFPKLAKFFSILYTVLAIPRYASFYNNPLKFLDTLARSILRITAFVSGAIGTSWGTICLFQYLLSATTLPRTRFFLGGFMGGLWAYIDRANGHGNFMYSFRMSMLSAWKVGVKRGWWRGFKGGDVALFVGALALLNVEREMGGVQKGLARYVILGLRGESRGGVARAEREDKEL